MKPYHQAYVRLRSKPSGEWLVHPELRPRLVAEAAEHETSLTDLVSSVLATRYGIPYELGSGRRSTPSREDEDVLNMRLPIAIWRAVAMAGSASDRKPNAVIREALCTHYGLALPTPVAVAA